MLGFHTAAGIERRATTRVLLAQLNVFRTQDFPENIVLNIGYVSNETNADVRMYIEEFILVEIWIHHCTKLKSRMNTLENTLVFIQSQQWMRNVRIALR